MESPLRNRIPKNCRLIETLRIDRQLGAVDIKRHLDRMCLSAQKLGFVFQRGFITEKIQTIKTTKVLRCRLTIDQAGAVEITQAPLAPTQPEWQVAISPQRLTSYDPWLRHKTTQRQIYDDARAALPPDIDEMIFFNEKNHLCEGTITNIFLQLKTGEWVTPPISSGCLPGVLRARKLAKRQVRAKIITARDLENCQSFWLGNALRGEIKGKLLLG
ncbi:MAG: aminotransferase class IV family protein [Rhodobacteraceae bacterium]|nr:aminotransferase class IV family protein [Paracoccaceae bacterium]MBL6641025.1 aminotransferase class IV family protein [Paracoccaceae bacterium]MBL6676522.1 aminotransferase class IV family protein [Paracoccaceae bacterium]MBL6789931.1 aminotransferase class IV family protein [Paracoccaceae bacterium]MBL6860475.1 aminotransferase class IV family protein [Paracoccaceae bacterium]